MSKQAYLTKVWESKNGRWLIVDVVSENETWNTEKGETRFKTTMYIDNQVDGRREYPIMYQDGRVAYDYPEYIPRYVKDMYAKKMGARREQQRKLHEEIAIVGYLNWCDTVCSECVASKHIDVSTFTALTHSQAVEDMGYTCDYCGMAFPKDVVLKLLQVN